MTIHGFELLNDVTIPEINARARVFRHERTGAQLVSMENDDENKVFGISFATPPTNSTGLPHIMEHSVLCGSRKYPVKEPFVELLKGSLNTFLNAFTFPDKTCYPVASQNVQDFYNLIDVYLDAVFYPRITPEILQQEGWHYELEELGDPIVYKGVVFNEMKGAYSSPDNVLGRYQQQSLFPDNTYGVDSGGDPTVIPDLTYADFKQFHDTYYHPSNAFIWFYGDDDPDERLRIIDAFIADFDALEIDSSVALQPAFDEPRRVLYSYAATEDEGAKKGMVTVNWLLPEVTDTEAALAFSILDYILIGTPASPLRKALIESGLGEDLTDGGLEADLRQMAFFTGLKGSSVDDADIIEALILDTLQGLVNNGIETEMVEAALNTIEFRLREQNTGRFPRGLYQMISALRTWLHDGDPLAHLAFEAPLNAIKARLEAGEKVFENLIVQYFLKNRHRTTVILEPDPNLQQQMETEEEARLAKVQAGMDEAQLQAVIADTEKLQLMQVTPDSPEALATIPSLHLEDLDKTIKTVPTTTSASGGSPVLYHDLFTNGIAYLDVGFNLRTLPKKYLPYVGLFGRALLEMGTEKEDFVKLSQRIGRKTGGIYPSAITSAIKDQAQGATWSFLRAKSTTAQTDDLLAILSDVLLTAQLDNRERFRQMVLEEKAETESSLIPSGHLVINTRLSAHFDEADWVAEQIGGLNYLFFLRQLADKIDRDWGAVLQDLETVRSLLINRQTALCNVTLDAENWQVFAPKLDSFLAGLPTQPVEIIQWTADPFPTNEGLTIPAQVNYVGKGANLYDLGYTLHGSILVIANFLRTTYLWERVRVQGGAYGGFCRFDQHSGVFSYLSYRDPNLQGTITNYDGTSAFLHELDLSQEEVSKSIIGTIGDMDAYQLPDAKGYSAMQRHLIGYDDTRRQQLRDEILSTTVSDFKDFAEVLDTLNQSGQVVVLGSQDDITAANAGGDWLTVRKVL